MILSIFIVLVVAGVAYFHYIQGFFSATISAVIAVLAAALAVSYHETVVFKLLQGNMPDIGPGVCLVVLFALTYVILRVIADTFVPGNLRLPVVADKVGSILMGIVAGLFAGGIVALAAEALPFGSSVGMFSRFTTNDARDVRLATSGQMEDTFVYGDMQAYDIQKARSEDRHELWIPADRVLLGAVKKFSDEGSLSGSQSFAAIHPDYPEELFLTNVGMQIGAKRSAVNAGTQQDVTVPDKGVFTLPSVTQSEGEVGEIRNRKLPPTLTPKPNEMILVVRVMFERKAGDSDSRVRFATGNCRLVAGGENYYPLGTLERGKHLYASALDDFLFAEVGKGADLLYVVPKTAVLADAKAPADKMKLADGVFVEVKRLARVDLSGKKVIEGVPATKDTDLIRKPEVVKAAGKVGAGAGSGESSSASAEPQPAGPLKFQDAQADTHLPHKVATGTADRTTNSFQTDGATGALADGKFTKLQVDGTQSVQRMAQGPYPYDELAAPDGQKIVRVHLVPAGDNPDAFEGQIANYKLVDANNTQHPVRGVIVALKTPQGADHMVVSYNSTADVTSVPHAEGRPTDVYLLFTVPAGTQLKNLSFNNQNIGATELTAG